jgi:flagellar hook-length control protein FliK
MNLTGILSTLGTLSTLSANAAAPSGNAESGGPSFQQVLSQGVAQRAQPSPQPQPAHAQAAQAQQPKPSEQAKEPDAAPQPQQAAAGSDSKAADAKPAADKDDAAATEDKDALADIPGASQAALMMQLMHAAGADAAKPEAKALAKDVAADAETALPNARLKPGIAAAGDDKALRAAGEALASASANAGAAAQPEPGYARLMAETVQARQLDGEQAQQSAQQPLPAAALNAALQQTTAAVQALQPQAGERLTPPVGSTAWDNALGQKVVWMASGGEQSASLTLNPPELGPLQVVLAVNNNQATVNFSAPQPEVRQALEAALPRLKEMMNEAGIQLGQANVGAGTQGQFSGFDRRGNDSPRRERGGDGFAVAGALAADGRIRHGVVRIAPDGAVDTFA